VLDAAAGHWSIRPAGRFETERRYLPGTLVLESTMRAGAGVLRLTEALALAPGARGHEIGLESPHALVRVAECLGGEVRVSVDYAPRLEYGRVVPRLVQADGALATLGGPERLFLRGHGLRAESARASAEFTLRAGERAAWSLQRVPGTRAERPPAPDPQRLLGDTVAAWRSWTALHDDYEGARAERVRLSALVVQGLTFQPSGAVVAAATTSLPEVLGGRRNYDYRYGWLRDGAFVARALRCATCSDEAQRYFEWMVRAASTCREDDHVQVVFGVEGERDLSERRLEHLAGHRDSRPVRVGNEAWRQRQLDVLGEVVGCAWLLGDELELDPFTAAFVCQLVDRAAAEWRRPDSGIWERREEERHEVASKLMCWVALDRGVRMAGRLAPHADAARWRTERDAVRAAILAHGYDEEAGAFVQALGSRRLDAAALLVGLVGFLPADDPRVTGTADAVERELGDGGLIRRTADREEGAFLPASFWLAECHARAGRPERARDVFERACGCANDLGLLAEMADPASGEPLGNLPLALSHVGLINAADSLGTCRRTLDVGKPMGGQTTRGRHTWARPHVRS